MRKDGRFINAGTNEFYRYGRKAQERVTACLTPNANGFFSIPADGGKYWTIGTSEGRYGEFAKFGETFLSVNRAGNVWAKEGTDKAVAFVAMVNRLLSDMKEANSARCTDSDDEETEEE